MTKKLVAYFSATDVTKSLAKKLAKAIGADEYEIKPAVPYTKADLNWMDKNARSTIEMQNYTSRPEMADDNFSVSEYDTIFLGFPIWWYIAPTIINTFLEKHDFSNKRIILFATSGGSNFGKAMDYLRTSVSDKAKLAQGTVLSGKPSETQIQEWIENINKLSEGVAI